MDLWTIQCLLKREITCCWTIVWIARATFYYVFFRTVQNRRRRFSFWLNFFLIEIDIFRRLDNIMLMFSCQRIENIAFDLKSDIRNNINSLMHDSIFKLIQCINWFMLNSSASKPVVVVIWMRSRYLHETTRTSKSFWVSLKVSLQLSNVSQQSRFEIFITY